MDGTADNGDTIDAHTPHGGSNETKRHTEKENAHAGVGGGLGQGRLL